MQKLEVSSFILGYIRFYKFLQHSNSSEVKNTGLFGSGNKGTIELAIP